jgi:hypothetical protein
MMALGLGLDVYDTQDYFHEENASLASIKRAGDT